MIEKFKQNKVIRNFFRVADVLKKYELSQLSAGIAYYFTLAIFPFLMFLAALVGLVALPAEALKDLLTAILSVSVAETVLGYYAYLASVTNVFSLFTGLGLSLYSASRAVGALLQGIEKMYGSTAKKNFFKRMLWSALFTVGIGFVLVFLLVAASLIGSLPALLGQGVWVYLLCVGVVFLVFSVFYCWAPPQRIRFSCAWPGSLLCVVLLHVISIGIGVYVRLSVRFSVLYGSIGAIVVVMLWLYLFGYLVLIGALVNRFWQIKKGG